MFSLPISPITRYGNIARMVNCLFLWIDAWRSNGTYFDAKGNLVTCADDHDQLVAISPKGKITVLVNDFTGTGSMAPTMYGLHQMEAYILQTLITSAIIGTGKSLTSKGRMYIICQREAAPDTGSFGYEAPNGIVGTPDGKYLYIADIKANKTYQIYYRFRWKLNR